MLTLVAALASAQLVFSPAVAVQSPSDFVVANDFWSTQVGTCNPTVFASGSIAFTTGTAGHPARYAWSASASANSGAMCTMGATSTLNGWLFAAGDTHTFDELFNMTTTTNTVLRIGFQDSTTVGAPVDGAWLNVSGTTVQGMTSSNSNPSTTASSYTLSAGVDYRARVIVYGTTSVTYELWAVPAGAAPLWTDSLATNIPSGAGRETQLSLVAFNTAGGVAVLVTWDWYRYRFQSTAR